MKVYVGTESERHRNLNFHWKEIENGARPDAAIQVSNDQVPLPTGLHVVEDFVKQDEVSKLVDDILMYPFIWEGFEQRRRVRRYQVGSASNDTKMPKTLRDLVSRLEQTTGHRPQHVSVEEYSTGTLKISQYESDGGLMKYNSIVTSFESIDQCQCISEKETGECTCFVAQIPLRASAIKHLNRPKSRHPTCWDLASPNHWTDIRIQEGTLIVKTDDCLWNWRARVSALPERSQPHENLLVVKFFDLPQSSTTTNTESPRMIPGSDAVDYNFDSFGYVPSTEEEKHRTGPMPPLEDVLTIIVTTSPIKSNPSTELLERTFETFREGGEEFALKCRKVIVCDGCRKLDDENETVTRRYTNDKQRMRNGVCSSGQAENYEQFKIALRSLCSDAPADSPFNNAVVEELDSRHGYGFALRHALRHCISTPYVCVIQHDRTFMRPTPILETTRAMWHHRSIKYVTMSMRSNLMYRDLFGSKYGRAYLKEYDDMILRPSELNLDSTKFGPNGDTYSIAAFANEKIRKSRMSLIGTYRVSGQNVAQQEWVKNNSNEVGKHQLTLSPVMFWYDNVHICETSHYRDFVFGPSYKMVAKGGFVEDKLSPVLCKTLERLGLTEGHSRFGCFMLDDHSGTFFTGHLDGGSYLTEAGKREIREAYR